MNPALQAASTRIEENLKKDPRQEVVAGVTGPREYLFTKAVVEWIPRLASHPSDALILATWGHVLGRWLVPRNDYPKTTPGYHKWRRAQAKFSAEETDKILKEEGADETFRGRVRELILKTTFPQDPESQVFEDATCLAFLEHKLESYVTEWEAEGKIEKIFVGTLEKMTPHARELALKISFSPRTAELIGEALKKILGMIIPA